MNKKYITVPAVLAAICVASAALIGLTHFGTEAYNKNHVSNEAPKTIKALYSDTSVTFGKIDDFSTISVTGSNTKVSLTDLYYVSRSDEKVGLAYVVDAGKPVKTEVLFTIAFEGNVDSSSLSSFRPTAINVYKGGDSGYDKNIVTLASYLVNGSTSLDGKVDYMSGGTKSQKYLIDGVKAARDHYASNYKKYLNASSAEKGAN